MNRVEKFIGHRCRDPVIYPRHHTVTLPLPELSPDGPTIVVPEPSGYEPTSPSAGPSR
jgi:hypothetical protein